MNAKKFSDAMSELDTKYIDESPQLQEESQNVHFSKVGSYCSLLVLDDAIDRICH